MAKYTSVRKACKKYGMCEAQLVEMIVNNVLKYKVSKHDLDLITEGNRWLAARQKAAGEETPPEGK